MFFHFSLFDYFFMRCSTCWLSAFMKPLIAIGSMAFWGTSCFSASESKMAASNDFHPYWPELNESEEKLDADQCIVTKLGVGKFCFHPSNRQKSFNTNDCYPKSQTNMVQSDEKALYWVLTPGYYGTLTEEKFPKTVSNMKNQCFSGDKEDGLPLSFLEEWLAIDTADCKEAILILSTGLKGQLGVSASLKEALENKKKKGAIKDYIIGTSKHAVRKHNEYVKAGNKVFTFISTVG